jgi:hypothetical protein
VTMTDETTSRAEASAHDAAPARVWGAVVE